MVVFIGVESLEQEDKTITEKSTLTIETEENKKVENHYRYLGKEYLGGIIFYLYTDSIGEQHGLIVSKADTNSKWQYDSFKVWANSTWDGYSNTNKMRHSPAKEWIKKMGPEWYLPSPDELT